MSTEANRPAVVATLRTEMEAAMVANFLVSEGILARIAGSSSRGGYSACQLEIQVAVRETEFERARTLLAEHCSPSRHPASQHHASQIRFGTWCFVAALPALLMMTDIPVPAWPTLMLFGFVICEGSWRLLKRRREVLGADNE